MANIGILGAGSWALGLSILLNDNKHDITVWSALPEEIDILKENHENPKFLPGVHIPEEIHLTKDISEVAASKDVIIMAVASKFIRTTAASLSPCVLPGQIIVNVAKGLEAETLMTPKDVIREEIPGASVYVLSGPSHAEEVSRKIPTLVTIAGDDPEECRFLQNVFSSNVFRVYTSSDTLGLELGGALKNVIALAAGIADGLGYGDNLKAALITRGLKEISRLALKMGAQYDTLYGLSGMGDLIVTCTSMHSRNRRAGILIGQGKTMQEAIEEVNMVVEGIVCAKAAKQLADKYEVEMPIVNEINRILFEGADPEKAVFRLMNRDRTNE